MNKQILRTIIISIIAIGVVRNTIETSVTDVRPHDIVYIYVENGHILAINIVAGSLFTWFEILVPLLFASLVAGFIALLRHPQLLPKRESHL